MSAIDPITNQAIGPSNKDWQGLVEPGTITNLYNRPVTRPPAGPHLIQRGLVTSLSGKEYGDYKGARSTTLSATYTTKDDARLAPLMRKYGKDSAILLPTVVDGKFLTDDEAINRYLSTGQHLGVFRDLKSSEPYATALHNSQQAIGNFYGARSGGE